MPPLALDKLLLSACAALTLCGCGTSPATKVSNPPTPAQLPPTTLTGNWLLTGARVPAVYPTASTSLFIQGNQVTGTANFSAQCAGTPSSTFAAGGFPLSGNIANDGTFQAGTGNIGLSPQGTFSLSLTGNSPLAATPTVWTGTYAIAYTPGTTGFPCAIAQSGSFAATPIASVTGTYLGVPGSSSTAGPFGTGAIVTLQITQGAPALLTRGNVTNYQIPLSANLNITNSPCALATSTAGASQASSLGGDHLELIFPVGTTGGGLTGTLNDATANTFSATLNALAMANGCSGGLAAYTFTRK